MGTNIRKELFNLKQRKDENNLEFLEKINQIIQMADWQNISIIEAICLIFISGATCEDSKQICSKFMTKTHEGDMNKLRQQLEVVNEISKEEPEIENCTICGKMGHKHDKCEAKCHICASYNHFPGSCQGPAITNKQKRKREYRKKKKLRLRLEKSNLPGGECWTESLSYGDTVVDQEEDIDTTSESQQGDAEERQGDCIKRASEVIEGVPIEQISAAVESIKKAKYTDNTGLDLISQNLNFRDIIGYATLFVK